jgi:clorobiocin biosynthesis protein CloN5
MSETVEAALVGFIQTRLLGPDQHQPVDERTPLLELGVLDSLKVAMLLNFIRTELGADIPQARFSATTFRDVYSIAAVVAAVRTGTDR